MRRLTPEDAPACDAIIAALPYFFGDPIGVRNAASDLRKSGGWVIEDERRVTGFLCLTRSTLDTAEIAWMAVHPEFQRGGRGRILVSQAVESARAEGLRMLMLFTSAQEDSRSSSHGFHATRAFYREMGFAELCVLKPEGWTEEHLLMARAL